MNKKIVAASLAVVTAGALLAVSSVSNAGSKNTTTAERIKAFDDLDYTGSRSKIGKASIRRTPTT